MGFSTNFTFSDGISIAVLCADGTCYCCVENTIVSLPYSGITGNGTMHKQLQQTIFDVTGIQCPVSSIFRVYKIWVPNQAPAKYYTHVVFLINIKPDVKKKFKAPIEKFTGKLKWLTESDVSRAYAANCISTPTLLELFPKVLTDPAGFTTAENETSNVITEVGDSCLIDQLNSSTDITVDSSGLKSAQLSVYKEFIALAYPEVFMSFLKFCKFFADQGVAKEDFPSLFRAADVRNRRFLSFRDFIGLLAVMEPNTNHGGIVGEVRCRYIFRFFDKNIDGRICLKELREMLIYLRKSKGQPVDAANVDKELKTHSSLLHVTASHSLDMLDFLKYAGELKIKGLSQILRFPKSIKASLEVTEETKRETRTSRISQQMSPKPIKTVDPVQYTKQGSYEVAVHTIKMQKSGTIINIENIWNLKEVVSAVTLEQANITKDSRRASVQINAQDSLCNEQMKSLRYLANVNKVKGGNRGLHGNEYTWGNLSSLTFAQRLIEICKNVVPLFSNEPRMLDIKSPLYILGDFHGNFGDLQSFESMLWPLGPMYCPCGLLCLGDYVDRGFFSIEIITYLFCYKLLCPQKLKMIRGNHEIREIQRVFSFQAECVSKFGEKVGLDVWESINKAFDVMPLAAVVDGALFCCHGGIPPPWLCPVAAAINSIPNNLPEPDIQSTLAWELMWNDPVREKQLTKDTEIELKHNSGFATNTRRGTAHVFDYAGLEHFLNVNKYSHVIRAHEVALAGYSILLRGKLITVFSSSNYNGGSNQAACILVDKGKLRMMRLDPNT